MPRFSSWLQVGSSIRIIRQLVLPSTEWRISLLPGPKAVSLYAGKRAEPDADFTYTGGLAAVLNVPVAG